MPYRVETVDGRRALKEFLHLPFAIYKNDPLWIPPLISEVRRVLDPKKNPYFANASVRLFICYSDDRPVARTAVVINSIHEAQFGVRAAFFGFFESMNDAAAVRLLFEGVAEYCKAEHVDTIEGPFNPHHYSELGILLSPGNTPCSFFQTYNPPYYPELLEGAGFHISKRIFTAKNEAIGQFIAHSSSTRFRRSESGKFRIRSFRMNDFKRDLENVREVFNDAFERNWHFLPVSREEYEFSTKFLRFITSPELTKIVEVDGEIAGVLMCVPDINPLLQRLHGTIGPLMFFQYLRGRKHLKTLIVYAVGIKKKYQRTAAIELLFHEMCEMAKGYDVLETTWMSHDNLTAVRCAERFKMEPDREFAIYEKLLTPGRPVCGDIDSRMELNVKICENSLTNA